MKRKEEDLTYLERVYSKMLKKDPNSFLFLPLASVYYHKGNLAKAIDALQKGLAVHSNYVTAKYYLAFLYRENGEVDKAAEIFKKVACDSQGHYAAHKALVQYYLDKKDEKSALTELKKLALLPLALINMLFHIFFFLIMSSLEILNSFENSTSDRFFIRT